MRLLRSLAVLATLVLLACGDDGSPTSIDATVPPDANPACAGADPGGGFVDCALCNEIGSGCDTISVDGRTSMHCDCTASCPCGFRCDDIEIAPGVVVGNVCVR